MVQLHVGRDPGPRKEQGAQGKTIGQIAKEQNKRVIDAFLDLVVEENLDTGLMQSENNVDDEAMAKILTYPNAIVGLSDGGAHVQFHGGYGYCTRLLAEWVREKHVMSLEHAVRRLTFNSASALGLYDRGLIRPGMAADIVIFDPDTVHPLPESVVHDFPAGGWRMKEPAEGIMATIVNGQVLMEDGKHTGALPGRVLRNTYYHANHANLGAGALSHIPAISPAARCRGDLLDGRLMTNQTTGALAPPSSVVR